MSAFFGFDSIKKYKRQRKTRFIIVLVLICTIGFVSGYLSVKLQPYEPEPLKIRLYKPKNLKKSLTK